MQLRVLVERKSGNKKPVVDTVRFNGTLPEDISLDAFKFIMRLFNDKIPMQRNKNIYYANIGGEQVKVELRSSGKHFGNMLCSVDARYQTWKVRGSRTSKLPHFISGFFS